MAGFVVAMTAIARDDKHAAICHVLRCGRPLDDSPALGRALIGQPFILRVGEQNLSMFRRSQDIDAKPLGRRGDESATMSVTTRRGLRTAVGEARLPINMSAGDPLRFNAHSVELPRQPLAFGT